MDIIWPYMKLELEVPGVFSFICELLDQNLFENNKLERKFKDIKITYCINRDL